MNASRSYQRTLVDEALTRRDTTLPSFVEAGKVQGKSIEEIWLDLRNVTGVSFTSRTFYRWLEDLEEIAS